MQTRVATSTGRGEGVIHERLFRYVNLRGLPHLLGPATRGGAGVSSPCPLVSLHKCAKIERSNQMVAAAQTSFVTKRGKSGGI